MANEILSDKRVEEIASFLREDGPTNYRIHNADVQRLVTMVQRTQQLQQRIAELEADQTRLHGVIDMNVRSHQIAIEECKAVQKQLQAAREAVVYVIELLDYPGGEEFVGGAVRKLNDTLALLKDGNEKA